MTDRNKRDLWVRLQDVYDTLASIYRDAAGMIDDSDDDTYSLDAIADAQYAVVEAQGRFDE